MTESEEQEKQEKVPRPERDYAMTDCKEESPMNLEELSARELAEVLRMSGVKVPRLMSAAMLRQAYRMELKRRRPVMNDVLLVSGKDDSSVPPHGCGQASAPARLNAWQMDACFKCPVCGVCLTLAEQQHLLRKAGFPLKNTTPFDIHEILVTSLDAESRLSRMVDALLQRKFTQKTKTLLLAEGREFLSLWHALYEEADDAALWAAAVRPQLSEEHRRVIFGRIHLAMHFNAGQQSELKRKLSRQADENARMRELHEEAVRARRAIQKENQSLAKMNEELRKTIDAARREKAALEMKLDGLKGSLPTAGIEEEIRRLTAKSEAVSSRNTELDHRIAVLKEENGRLRDELVRQREAGRVFTIEAQQIIGRMRTITRCDESCPTYDLCRKRVLLVGGMTRMESLYRQLIEAGGGVFEYHDGYVKGGTKQLELSLKRADMVLCPVDCNSHAACSLVKNLGKKYRKPVHMLSNSSLSAVLQVMGKDHGRSSEGN